MNSPAQPNNTARLIDEPVLTAIERKAASDRAFIEQFGEDGRKPGSHSEYLFNQSLYAGEMRLKKLGQLELFRQAQRLPDYHRAEAANRQGWLRFYGLEFEIKPDQEKDKLKLRQHQLLYALRLTKAPEARRDIVRQFSIVISHSAKLLDGDFLIKFGRALEGQSGVEEGINDSAQVLLYHWLTSFWWLMPTKAVASEMARIQGRPDDGEMIKRFEQRLWQFKNRKPANRVGTSLSAGWSGCFYSANPSLIGSVENDGRLVFTAAGRRLLVT